MNLHTLTLDEWNKLAETAHMICFNEERPAFMNTFDFALFVEENDVPLAYATCIELDKHSVYMQHGGVFPSATMTVKSFKAYEMIMDYLRNKYVRASTRVERSNKTMRRFAEKVGFEINGIDNFGAEIFIHFQNDFQKEQI